MGYKAKDLVVGVTYYNNRICSVEKCCNSLENSLDEYRKLLVESNKNAILEGKTSETLSAYIESVKKINGIIKSLGTEYKKTICDFLGDIDTADDLLYDSSFTGRKYFTDDEFARTDRIVSHQPFSLENFGNWIIQGVLECYWRYSKDNVSRLASRVNNLDEKTARKLNAIKKNVRRVDSSYKFKLKTLKEAFDTVESILKTMNEIVNPDLSYFNIEKIKELDKSINSLVLLSVLIEKHDLVTDDSIIAFARDADEAIEYFSAIDGVFANYMEKHSDMFTVNKYTTIKNEMLDTFNQYSSDYVFSKQKYEEYKKQFDEYIDAIKKYGDEWTKHVDGDASMLDSFIKGLGKGADGIKNFEKYAADYVDVLYQLFFSMEESKLALQSFKANCDMSDKTVKAAFEHLESLYNKELIAFIEEIQEQIINDEWSTVKNLLNKGPLIVIGYAINGIGTYWENHNIDDQMDAISLYSWVNESGKAYENAIRKLSEANKTDANYNELISNLRYCFDIAKKAKLSMLKCMIEGASDWEKDYYKYCYNQVNTASMNDESSLLIMSKEEYKSYGNNNNPLDSLQDAVMI